MERRFPDGDGDDTINQHILTSPRQVTSCWHDITWRRSVRDQVNRPRTSAEPTGGLSPMKQDLLIAFISVFRSRSGEWESKSESEIVNESAVGKAERWRLYFNKSVESHSRHHHGIKERFQGR